MGSAEGSAETVENVAASGAFSTSKGIICWLCTAETVTLTEPVME